MIGGVLGKVFELCFFCSHRSTSLV